jgi:hypothetical protein
MKSSNKWIARCKTKSLGMHAAEEDAARAYNVEAARHGFTLNVIPTTGAAGAGEGAGCKRAPPATAASRKNKKVKLADTSSVWQCRLTRANPGLTLV